MAEIEREAMEYDVVIVGAGFAGMGGFDEAILTLLFTVGCARPVGSSRGRAGAGEERCITGSGPNPACARQKCGTKMAEGHAWLICHANRAGIFLPSPPNGRLTCCAAQPKHGEHSGREAGMQAVGGCSSDG